MNFVHSVGEGAVATADEGKNRQFGILYPCVLVFYTLVD